MDNIIYFGCHDLKWNNDTKNWQGDDYTAVYEARSKKFYIKDSKDKVVREFQNSNPSLSFYVPGDDKQKIITFNKSGFDNINKPIEYYRADICKKDESAKSIVTRFSGSFTTININLPYPASRETPTPKEYRKIKVEMNNNITEYTFEKYYFEKIGDNQFKLHLFIGKKYETIKKYFITLNIQESAIKYLTFNILFNKSGPIKFQKSYSLDLLNINLCPADKPAASAEPKPFLEDPEIKRLLEELERLNYSSIFFEKEGSPEQLKELTESLQTEIETIIKSKIGDVKELREQLDHALLDARIAAIRNYNISKKIAEAQEIFHQWKKESEELSPHCQFSPMINCNKYIGNAKVYSGILDNLNEKPSEQSEQPTNVVPTHAEWRPADLKTAVKKINPNFLWENKVIDLTLNNGNKYPAIIFKPIEQNGNFEIPLNSLFSAAKNQLKRNYADYSILVLSITKGEISENYDKLLLGAIQGSEMDIVKYNYWIEDEMGLFKEGKESSEYYGTVAVILFPKDDQEKFEKNISIALIKKLGLDLKAMPSPSMEGPLTSADDN